jgi:ribose transport system substrate-binding protein
MTERGKSKKIDRLRLILAGVILAMIVGIVIFAFTSSQRQKGPKKVIAVAKTTDTSVAFWLSVRSGMEEAGREFSVDVDFRAPASESDIEGQIRMMDQAIAEKPDAILLSASDQHLLVAPVLRARDAGIPVLMFDSSIEAQTDKFAETFVATDNVRAGGLAASAILEAVPDGSTVAIIAHNINTTSGHDRESGIRNGIDGHYEVLDTYDCEGSKERAFEEARRLLARDDVAAIICTNEYTTSATLDAIAEQAEPRDVVVVGFDNSYQMMNALEDRTLTATVIQKAFTMGYLAVDKTVRHLNKEALEPFYDSDSALITRDVMYEKENEQLLFPFNPQGD